ncbi:MAG TPA: hypothetical protein VH418_14240, partial [Solirubrobacteraceae bacterium]
FGEGDIVAAGEASEEGASIEDDPTVEVQPSPGGASVPVPATASGGSSSLGIGGLKGGNS